MANPQEQSARMSPELSVEHSLLSHSHESLLLSHEAKEAYQSPRLTHYGRFGAMTLDDGDGGGGGFGGGGPTS